MDLSWIATEAKTLHQVFAGMFYTFATILLILGVVIDFLKIPLGGSPEMAKLIGRVLIATILMAATPEIMNTLSSVADGIVAQIGDYNSFQYVKARLKDQLLGLSFSWTSVKDLFLIGMSILSYVVLIVGLHLADALFLFAWVLLYVFSPILNACFVLPATSGATKQLFKSMVEVTIWKITWCVMGALVWSMAASDLNKAGTEINFLTVIILNIMMFLSLWKVPKLTSAFLQFGISSASAEIGGSIFQKGTDFAKTAMQVHTIGKLRKALSSSEKPRSPGDEGPPPVRKSYQMRKKQESK